MIPTILLCKITQSNWRSLIWFVAAGIGWGLKETLLPYLYPHLDTQDLVIGANLRAVPPDLTPRFDPMTSQLGKYLATENRPFKLSLGAIYLHFFD